MDFSSIEINTFRVTYKRHTNFSIENKSDFDRIYNKRNYNNFLINLDKTTNNNSCGQFFLFSELNNYFIKSI